MIGSDVLLDCMLPNPGQATAENTAWAKNGVSLDLGKSGRIRVDPNGALVIRNIMKSDAGERKSEKARKFQTNDFASVGDYTCQRKGLHGSLTSMATLEVLESCYGREET